jgi:hypothetical protein
MLATSPRHVKRFRGRFRATAYNPCNALFGLILPCLRSLLGGASIAIYPFIFLLGLIAMGIAVALIVLVMAYPNLPPLEVLTDYRPKIPLRVYSADGFPDRRVW